MKPDENLAESSADVRGEGPSSFSSRILISLMAALVALTTPRANAQHPVGTTTVFRSDHQPITIERFDPKTGSSHLAVMLVHGGGGPEGDWRKGGILEALTTAGYSVFVPHYFDGAGKWSPSDKPEKFLAYIRTLNDASRYMAAQPGIRNKGIGVGGFSLGGYLVLALAEEEHSHPPPLRSPEIKAVVEFYGAMPDFAEERITTMPPVLILHGEEDDVVPVSHAYDLEKLLKKKAVPHEIKVYPHQGHGFSGDALEDSNKRTVSFLSAHLR
ncbi:MAG TPA: dienelactone hydrolase family protein [Terriglobales bacterium]|nr:dienelactone hydrolase family protein [Terriglobales bacterium]